jgi:hypothetical protein
MVFTSPVFTKLATAQRHSVAKSSTEFHINWLRNIARDVEIHFRGLKRSMTVTAPFLNKLSAALKLLTKTFVSNLIKILLSNEAVILGYAEKDGQT